MSEADEHASTAFALGTSALVTGLIGWALVQPATWEHPDGSSCTGPLDFQGGPCNGYNLLGLPIAVDQTGMALLIGAVVGCFGAGLVYLYMNTTGGTA